MNFVRKNRNLLFTLLTIKTFWIRMFYESKYCVGDYWGRHFYFKSVIVFSKNGDIYLNSAAGAMELKNC